MLKQEQIPYSSMLLKFVRNLFTHKKETVLHFKNRCNLDVQVKFYDFI